MSRCVFGATGFSRLFHSQEAKCRTVSQFQTQHNAGLEKLLADRQTLQVLIDTTVLTTREALDVPDGWTLSSLDRRFHRTDRDKWRK
jgi:glutamine synthetase type III